MVIEIAEAFSDLLFHIKSKKAGVKIFREISYFSPHKNRIWIKFQRLIFLFQSVSYTVKSYKYNCIRLRIFRVGERLAGKFLAFMVLDGKIFLSSETNLKKRNLYSDSLRLRSAFESNFDFYGVLVVDSVVPHLFSTSGQDRPT